jgi:limonene-1,2-epoxide hydrolase
MGTTQAETVVDAFLSSWGPDWPTFRSAYETYLSADCVYENTGMPTATGIDEILALVDAFAALTGMVCGEAKIRHSFANDTVVLNERAEVWRKADGTPILEVPVAVMGAFEVADGKITHWRDYWDAAPVVAILSGEQAAPTPAS